MQIQKLSLSDGSSISLLTMEETSPPRDAESFIKEAIATSEQEDGCHVIVGNGLDLSPTKKEIKIVASSGNLLIQNMLNP